MPSSLEKHMYLICQDKYRPFEEDEDSDRESDEEIISRLVAEGASVNFQFKGSNPLCEACRRGKINIARALLQHGATVNQADTYLCSPLYLAASHGHLSLCKVLLQAGADLNQKNKFEYTPLLSAIENSHFMLTEYLISQGAGVNPRTPISSRVRFVGSLFDYVAFQTNSNEQMRKLVPLLLKAGAMTKHYNQLSTFWILTMNQINSDILEKMLHIGFTFDFQEVSNFCERTKALKLENKDTDKFRDIANKEFYPDDNSEEDAKDRELMDLILYHTKNAHSLQNIARIRIRGLLALSNVQTHITNKIDVLTVPKSLKGYLNLDDIL
ncbi:hypothetical protein FSP39_003911 [Pinctada imbricata]|uniref:SOCS box domain-containing protein n=1 Tax=Pinctada imbricata TaxID=66713 RepID=A0AA88YM78_PINIB|nr:hypothetical protein FSP39_003911 [Pinctada imbricata]